MDVGAELWVVSSPDAMTLVSPGLASRLGYTTDELEHRALTDPTLVHIDDIERTRKMLTSMEDTKVEGFTNRWRAKSGEFVRLRWSAARWCYGSPLTMMTCAAV